MKTLYYDCGELGWSLYLLGHINWLIKYKNFTDFSICTYKNRMFLYEHLPIEVLEIPYQMMKEIKDFDMDGTHLFKHDTQERIHNNYLIKLFNYYYGDEYSINEDYNKFQNESLHESIPSSSRLKAKADKLIPYGMAVLVFPRARIGKFASRNLPKNFYVKLINRLISEFNYINIVSIGLPSSSYNLSNAIGHKQFVDLTTYKEDDMLELLITILNSREVMATVGSQSALPKVSLLQKVQSYMIGHERKRHTETDNWMNTRCGFYTLDRSYKINIDNCVDHFIKWIRNENSI
jgi:hypothetical protein